MNNFRLVRRAKPQQEEFKLNENFSNNCAQQKRTTKVFNIENINIYVNIEEEFRSSSVLNITKVPISYEVCYSLKCNKYQNYVV